MARICGLSISTPEATARAGQLLQFCLFAGTHRSASSSGGHSRRYTCAHLLTYICIFFHLHLPTCMYICAHKQACMCKLTHTHSAIHSCAYSLNTCKQKCSHLDIPPSCADHTPAVVDQFQRWLSLVPFFSARAHFPAYLKGNSISLLLNTCGRSNILRFLNPALRGLAALASS